MKLYEYSITEEKNVIVSYSDLMVDAIIELLSVAAGGWLYIASH